MIDLDRNHLIILVGGSGAGKSFLLSRIKDINIQFRREASQQQKEKYPEDKYPLDNFPYCVIKKYTTRSPRSSEKNGTSDLRFNATDIDFEKCGETFRYSYGAHVYGLDCREIETALREHRSPIVIVRDYSIVKFLKEKFAYAIDVNCASGLGNKD